VRRTCFPYVFNMEVSVSRYHDRMGLRLIFVVVAIFSGMLAAVFSWSYLNPFAGREIPTDQAYRQGAIIGVIESDGETFPVPVPALWEGEIFGILEGGQAFAVRRRDGAGDFYAFFEDESEPLEGIVRVHGLWLGSTCAYRNTVFSGRCVPEVKIRKFEILERTQEE